MKQALILSGGQGTRAKNRIGNTPKSLIKIGDKPLLWHQLNLLEKYKYDEVLLLTHHFSDQIFKYINKKNNWNLNIKVIKEEAPKGTGGSVLNCFASLSNNFLVIYGDTMLDVNLEKLERFHKDNNADASIFIHPNDHPNDSDLIEIDENNSITAFHSYPHEDGIFYSNLVNAALYYIRKSSLIEYEGRNKKFDFIRDIFPKLLKSGHVIKGYNSPEYIKDCGTPYRIDKVNRDYISGYINECRLDRKQPCIFIDRDGTINKEMDHLKSHEDFVLLPGVTEAIKKINSSKYRSIVVTNQPVIARGDCSLDDLNKIHNKMEMILGSHGSYLDRIYFCPHHPDSGFTGEVTGLKINCDCRKPKTGMIDNAIMDFNINRSQSWFVGDSTSDIMTAKNAGIRSILLETGYAGHDEKYHVQPDYTISDLNSAVDFILNGHDQLKNLCDLYLHQISPGDFVFVGGLSKVGKTNFSASLRECLIEKGINAVILSIDSWLLNENERGVGVLNRYEVSEVERHLKRLDNREDNIILNIPKYSRIKRNRSDKTKKFKIKKLDVVIVEGTISMFFLESILESNKLSIFLNLDEKIRYKRLVNDYKKRGYDEDQIKKIYNDRESDEHKIITASSSRADKNLIF